MSVEAAREAAQAEMMDDEDFEGLKAQLETCEGARMMHTGNTWVEAGLMNGAMDDYKGEMLPDGFDPLSEDPKLRAPICVFMAFDRVNLGVDG